MAFIIPILTLTLVITIHELGHFIFAKIFGVKVETFSVGIGKKIFTKEVNGTEYALSLIPFGGYCKLKGGDLENPNMDMDSADRCHPLKRAIIYLAGPLFNFVLAFLFISVLFMLPVNQKIEPIISPITGKNLPGELAGLKDGDRLISINGKKIKDFQTISSYIKDGENIFLINRNNEELTIPLTPVEVEGRKVVGITPFIPLTVKQSSSKRVLIGDRITHINNLEVKDYYSLIQEIDNNSSFKLTIERDAVVIEEYLFKEELESFSFNNYFSHNFLTSIKLGFKQTFKYLGDISSYLLKLISRGEMTDSLSSPIRLVYDIGNSFTQIDTNILFIIQRIIITISSISLTLGFINLVPIPILDGGQIIVNIVTLIKGSPLNRKVLYVYQVLGLIIILFLFIIGITNDLIYLGDR